MKTTDVYEIVTEKIIAAMEAGVVPWRKPWNGVGGPTSLATGKPYRGINNLILEVVAMSEGYELPLWGTFKQAKALGGTVRKGEKGTPVVLWKPVEKKTDDGKMETFMLLRYFTVFNVAQMDGIEIPEKYLVKGEPVEVLSGVSEALAYEGGPAVQHLQQDRAFYTAKNDTITLPLLEQFGSPEAYAATALHEVIHSTGHESRLDRDMMNRFGCEGYAQEELVAEIGAAMLATVLGMEVEYEQHAAYLTGWLKALKDDRKMIVQAAQQAQKAVDRVIGVAVEKPEAVAA